MKHAEHKNTLFLIDGSSFLYRAYYGLRPLHTKSGEQVQAVYSFCRMIKKMIDTFGPEYIALVWDTKGPTVRHEEYAAYKATRQAAPSDLFIQKERICAFADMIGLAQVGMAGLEADDLIYSLAKDGAAAGMKVVMITSDKDMAQLIDENIVMYDAFKEEFFDKAAYEEKMGFSIEKLPFYYALLGDASDNIPGVKGIGKKGATELVQQFASLEALYANLDAIEKPRTRACLEEYKENAFLSKKLFTLRYKDLGLKKEQLHFDAAQWSGAAPLFAELEFKSLLKDLGSYLDAKPVTLLSEKKGYHFIAVQTHAQLDELIAQIRQCGVCAVDTETSGLDSLDTDLVGISLCVQEGTAYYIPVGHAGIELQLSRDEVVKKLQPVLEDRSIKKYLQNAKFDMRVLWQYGIGMRGIAFDTLIAAHLVAEDWQRIGLKYLSQHYLNEDMLSFKDVVNGNGYKDFSQLPLALATEYAAADAHQTLRLVPILQEKLKELHMEKLFYTIELPLVELLFAMETAGIYCDADLLRELDALVTVDLIRIEQEIRDLVGKEKEELNLNSPKQLEQILFYDLSLPPYKKTKTGYSTDQEVLEALSKIHPVPRFIIRYRTLSKLQNTYLQALPGAINQKTNHIHTSFRQTAVATGRLSSSEPNMQNIPTYTPGYSLQVRAAFKPAQDHILLSADYSQIELRVLAYLSQDAALLKAFADGRDIHTETAALLFDVAPQAVTTEQRQLGKRINFSILYGLTPYGLSKDLHISMADAKQYIDKYFAQYPGVRTWMDTIIQECRQKGYVTTHWGRRRYIPAIHEKNKNLYEAGVRAAINTVAQGTAAEIMKKGMLTLGMALLEKGYQAKIVLQIHDELVLSVPKHELALVQALVQEVLESVTQPALIQKTIFDAVGDTSWNVP
ncbi:MAG: DNA polymerase I, partial [Candidatus Babeliales bacterium]